MRPHKAGVGLGLDGREGCEARAGQGVGGAFLSRFLFYFPRERAKRRTARARAWRDIATKLLLGRTRRSVGGGGRCASAPSRVLLIEGLHRLRENEVPMCPVRAALRVHDKWFTQRAIRGELERGAFNEGAVSKDDFMPIARRDARHGAHMGVDWAHALHSLAARRARDACIIMRARGFRLRAAIADDAPHRSARADRDRRAGRLG